MIKCSQKKRWHVIIPTCFSSPCDVVIFLFLFLLLIFSARESNFFFSFWAVQVFECFWSIFHQSLWQLVKLKALRPSQRDHVIIKLHLNYGITTSDTVPLHDYLPSKPITFSEYLYSVYRFSSGKKLKEIQLSTNKYPFDVATKIKQNYQL